MEHKERPNNPQMLILEDRMRSVSEQVAAVYDPLGWLTPLTLAGKRFLQQLWKFNYQWDSALSKEHQTQWKNITESIEDFFYTKAKKAPVRLGYVNSTDNPADCATRGVDKNNFINHIWWKGPTFIKKATGKVA
ncbi:hypothetical protein OSTOST_14770 [Ostertagia ostertagi]